MQIKYGLNSPTNSSGLLRKLVAFVLTVAMVGLVLMFSAVLLVVIAIIGTLGWAYLWWKTRELRKRMRDYQPRPVPHQTNPDTDVFEGEVIRVVEQQNGK
ncbi:MAG: hypothetical protein WAW02_01035 [Sideroxyarcus sp.]